LCLVFAGVQRTMVTPRHISYGVSGMAALVTVVQYMTWDSTQYFNASATTSPFLPLLPAPPPPPLLLPPAHTHKATEKNEHRCNKLSVIGLPRLPGPHTTCKHKGNIVRPNELNLTHSVVEITYFVCQRSHIAKTTAQTSTRKEAALNGW